MKHFTVASFWQKYALLPKSVQRLADKNFKLLEADSSHPSLNFKPVGKFWSARVGIHHRALATKDDGEYVWFWIGEHGPYERLIR